MNCAPSQAMSGRFLWVSSVADSIKGFSKVQADNTHRLFSSTVWHTAKERDQVGQARPAFHKSVLAGPNPLVVWHELHDTLKITCSITFPGTEVRLMGL